MSNIQNDFIIPHCGSNSDHAILEWSLTITIGINASGGVMPGCRKDKKQ